MVEHADVQPISAEVHHEIMQRLESAALATGQNCAGIINQVWQPSLGTSVIYCHLSICDLRYLYILPTVVHQRARHYDSRT
jgi:hypothetical protein